MQFPKFERSDRNLIALLLLIALLSRLPFIASEPLIKDEALYAEMIDEFNTNPTLLPRFLGYEVAWRPPLFFYIYAPMVKFLSTFPLQTELLYRLPTLLLALATIPVLFHLTKELYSNKDLAFLSTLIYATTPLTIYMNNTVLTDTLLVFFILLSLLCYARGRRDERYFLAAGLFSFAAFMVKTVVAFMIPVLAVAYFLFSKDQRRMLANKYFLLSLLAIPLAILIYYLMFTDKAAILAEYSKNVTQKIANEEPFILRLDRSILPMLYLSFFWAGLYLVGVARNLKFDKFLLAWAALIIFPVLGGYMMPWYFLPILPALSIFAALLFLDKKMRLDKLGALVCSILVIFSLASLLFIHGAIKEAADSRDAGLFLAGKQNLLIAGNYRPSLLFYKLHAESAAGSPNLSGFCWLYMADREHWNNASYLSEAVYNYSSMDAKYNFSTRATDLFWERRETKLPCNISKFDYLALLEVNESFMEGSRDYQLIKRFDENISVYSRIR